MRSCGQVFPNKWISDDKFTALINGFGEELRKRVMNKKKILKNML